MQSVRSRTVSPHTAKMIFCLGQVVSLKNLLWFQIGSDLTWQGKPFLHACNKTFLTIPVESDSVDVAATVPSFVSWVGILLLSFSVEATSSPGKIIFSSTPVSLLGLRTKHGQYCNSVLLTCYQNLHQYDSNGVVPFSNHKFTIYQNNCSQSWILESDFQKTLFILRSIL